MFSIPLATSTYPRRLTRYLSLPHAELNRPEYCHFVRHSNSQQYLLHEGKILMFPRFPTLRAVSNAQLPQLWCRPGHSELIGKRMAGASPPVQHVRARTPSHTPHGFFCPTVKRNAGSAHRQHGVSQNICSHGRREKAPGVQRALRALCARQKLRVLQPPPTRATPRLCRQRSSSNALFTCAPVAGMCQPPWNLRPPASRREKFLEVRSATHTFPAFVESAQFARAQGWGVQPRIICTVYTGIFMWISVHNLSTSSPATIRAFDGRSPNADISTRCPARRRARTVMDW
ncbi:hypothetical protein K438DRAFT_1776456 [Mycena galopus ATCC 62051]|nr:hypothetical protein K438DRAFT_1776456 [Mycena galopus ATCC 62051]